jgi:hypothetical protein
MDVGNVYRATEYGAIMKVPRTGGTPVALAIGLAGQGVGAQAGCSGPPGAMSHQIRRKSAATTRMDPQPSRQPGRLRVGVCMSLVVGGTSGSGTRKVYSDTRRSSWSKLAR